MDGVDFFVNSKIGGSERDLKDFLSLQSQSITSPSLLILDHAESIFSSCNEVESDSDVSASYSIDSHSIESKMYLLAKSQIDRLILSKSSTVFCLLLVNNKNNITAEMKRPARFSRYFNINISTSSQRKQLLEHFLTSVPFKDPQTKEECIEILSGQPTSGFTVSDIQGFVQRTISMKSPATKEEGTAQNLHEFTLNDFLSARHFVNPSSIVSRVTLSTRNIVDSATIIGLEQQKESLYQYISAIFRNDTTSVSLPRGILIEGPSGCGKSLLAATLARLPFKPKNSSTTLSLPVNFIAVDSTQIISKYFGRSDKNLSEIFAEARRAAPCFLYFDQIDTLVGRRGGNTNPNSSSTSDNTSDRLVTTFLVEMDGLRSKLDADKSVIVLGTTSKKRLIDPAILRPGRLDLHVHVPLPSRKSRQDFITSFISRSLDQNGNSRYQLTSDEISDILDITEGSSFAQLDSIFREAAMFALRADITCEYVNFTHFFK